MFRHKVVWLRFFT